MHHLSFSLSISVTQTIISALSSVELTSILVLSHRLRITALLSSGCKATFEGLSNVQSYSATHNSGTATCRVSKVQRIFISGQLSYSAIPLFRIPRFTDSLKK